MAVTTKSRIDITGNPVISPVIYVPLLGVKSELDSFIETSMKLKKLAYNSEFKDSEKSSQYITLIELRSRLYEAGQIRSMLTIALSSACVVKDFFPVPAGILATMSLFGYVCVRRTINRDKKTVEELKKGTVFGAGIIKKLGIG